MKQEGHLKTYQLILKTVSPVFIGSGEQSAKFGYLFDKKNHIISMLDENKLMDMIISRNKIDEFEQAVLGHKLSSADAMFRFLSGECGLKGKEIHGLVRYNCDAGAAIDEKHHLMDIQLFMRRPDGKAYIPGSSLKGALRTVILYHLMKKQGRLGHGRRGERRIPEDDLLNTLPLKKDRNGQISTRDQVNSVMRGLEISDSEIIPDRQMTLCRKLDIKPGTRAEESSPNVCRECIKTGTTIKFAITEDDFMLRQAGINIKELPTWLDEFMQYYKENYESHFSLPDGGIHTPQSLILGGGSGFFAKTLTYPYFGNEALDIVTDQMSRSFRKHHHDKDRYLGISPHTMKYTEYDGKRYPMGICEVEIK